jgi:hypothetical protein
MRNAIHVNQEAAMTPTTMMTTTPRSNYGNVLRSLIRTFPNLSPDELRQLARDLEERLPV